MKKYWKDYDKPLTSKYMGKNAIRGFRSYRGQKDRCYNSRNPRYSTYGAKGICVEYSSREFIGWWLENLKSFKENKPSVSRIDHDKNYSFDNIKMESVSDNVKEQAARLGSPSKYMARKVSAYKYPCMELIKKYVSVIEASRELGIASPNIISLCRGRSNNGRNYLKTREGITFRYED